MKEKLSYIGLGIVIGWITDYAMKCIDDILEEKERQKQQQLWIEKNKMRPNWDEVEKRMKVIGFQLKS